MKVSNNVSLAPFTSLKAAGRAEKLVELDEKDSLAEVLETHIESKPVWILGYGTNCLVSDDGLPGTVVVNKAGGIKKTAPTRFRVDSGVNWDDFVQIAIRDNLWGVEFTSGIPGGVGAAVAGNIAAYGHKVANSFIKATILDTKTSQRDMWDKAKFQFSYRNSAIQSPPNHSLIILDAEFELSSEPTDKLEYESALKVAEELKIKPVSLTNRRKIIMETRRRAGSLLINPTIGPWTAGSFFKNPLVSEEQIKTIMSYEEFSVTQQQLMRQNMIHGENKARVSAAHVLLAAGFKRGQTWGNVGLHPSHILKIENLGRASAQEIYDVTQLIIKTVKDKLGIVLEPEVRFLGKFT